MTAIRRFEEASRRLTAELDQGHFTKHYKDLLHEIPVALHNRNDWIVTAAPILFRAVGKKVAKKLVEIGWQLYHPTCWSSDLQTHLSEFKYAMDNVEKSYHKTSDLSSEESEIYSLFSDEKKTAFRIIRDLAMRQDDRVFFLSGPELGRRLNVDQKIAWRILKDFSSSPYSILKMTKCGDRGRVRPGKRVHASEYLYLLRAGEPTVELHALTA